MWKIKILNFRILIDPISDFWVLNGTCQYHEWPRTYVQIHKPSPQSFPLFCSSPVLGNQTVDRIACTRGKARFQSSKIRPRNCTMTTNPPPTMVQPGRIRVLKPGSNPNGAVVYWMFRDQRVKDNWALVHAVDEANKRNAPVAVAFNLFDMFKGANARHLGFMLRGLKHLQASLYNSLHIPFFLFQVFFISSFFF